MPSRVTRRRDRPAPAATRRPGPLRPIAGRGDRGVSARTRIAGGILAVVLWIIAPAGVPAAVVPLPQRPAAAAGLPWLVARDGRISDLAGHTVLLRGFNTEALLETTDGGHAPLDDTDLELMRAEGFDSVRLPIVWSRIEPVRGTLDPAYLDLIQQTVARINARGMYVVVDMHFLDWGPRYGGSGAPLWAHLPGIPDVRPLGEPWGRHLSPAQNADSTYFWTSPDWQHDFFLAWQAVARRLRPLSGVAGYDLFNEPHPLPIPPGAFERQAMWPVYAQTISALGAVDANHMFIAEGTLFGDWGTAVQPLHAPNLVYSGHVYTGSLVPPAFDGGSGALVEHIDGQRRAAGQLGAPLWEGELGIDHRQPLATAWADAALDHLDDIGAGWSWWQWRQDDNWGIVNRAGTTVDTAFLRHLARPYPISAAPSVHAGRGDGGTGGLTLHIDGALHGVITVAWPASVPGPPHVTSDCASVAGAPEKSGRVALTVGATATCDVAVIAVGSQPSR